VRDLFPATSLEITAKVLPTGHLDPFPVMRKKEYFFFYGEVLPIDIEGHISRNRGRRLKGKNYFALIEYELFSTNILPLLTA